jgi:membrane-associated phospholipid phosphatase
MEYRTRTAFHPVERRRWKGGWLWSRLRLYDLYTLAIVAIYSVLAIALYPAVEDATFWLLLNGVVSMLVLLLAWADRPGAPAWIRWAHWFYLVPTIYLMYQQVHAYVPVVNPKLYDDLLIRWDYVLFGVHPTHWIARFAHPVLTEYLQTAYMLFYFLPLICAAELFRQRRMEALMMLARTLAFGFYVSYLCYFALPAIGPRFTLHEFARLDEELPGVWLTPIWRAYVNAGGGISAGAEQPERSVHRDCMPSGHTMMTLLTVVLAFRFRVRVRWVLAVLGASLIVATVYLRYHYVVDLLAGGVCALMVLWAEPRLARWIEQRLLPRAEQ